MRDLFFSLVLMTSSVGIGLESGEAARGESDWVTHKVESPHQRGETKVRVLLPSDLDRTKSYRVLFILPVEAGDAKRWGDALAEAKKLDLANKHQLICVHPTFSHLPWYADHASDQEIQQ